MMKLEVFDNSKNYTCQVVRVKHLRKHSNADRLACTAIQGNNVICGLDTKENELYLYFPLESQLSETLCKANDLIKRKDETGKQVGGMFEQSRRVKCLKLRGEKSEGFLAPIEYLRKLGISGEFTEGMEFNAVDGIEICRKYTVQQKESIQRSKQKKAKVHSKILDNQFRLHYDTSPFKKNISSFRKDDIVSITQKMHGTSIVMSNLICKKKLSLAEKVLKFLKVNVIENHYDYVYSSRKVIKNLDIDVKNYYSEDIWGICFAKYKDSIQKGYSVYGEIVGQLPNGQWIQKDYSYGTRPKQWELYVYRITLTNEDGLVQELSWQQVKNYCEVNGLKYVPELFYGRISEKFKYESEDSFLQELSNEYLEKVLPEKVPDEGVCIRNESKDFIAYKLKSFAFFEYETKQLDSNASDIEEQGEN
jgi:hypothetical protein